MTPAQVVLLVARREFVTQVKSRSFVIGIVLSLVIFAAIGIITAFVAGNDSKTLGLVGPAQTLGPAVAAGAAEQGVTVRVVDLDEQSGRAQLAAGDVDALLTGGPGSYVLLGDRDVDSGLTAVVSAATRLALSDAALGRAGVDTAALAGSSKVAVQTVQPQDPNEGQQLALAIVGTILLFTSLSGYGQLVATGVVEEKQSRVVELLLATIKPWQLLAGKVAGLGAVGLLQLVILGAIGVGVSTAFGVLTVPSAAVGMFALMVVWYLLGFFLFASLYAAVGSTVSRQEDLNTVVAPMIFLLLIPFILTVNLAPRDPHSTIITVLSYLPFFSQTVMPARYALGAAALWEVVVSAVLAIVAIVIVVRIAGRVYRNSILNTGSRVSFRAAMRG
jgi:ABC-2 type transport system permease protein